MNRRDFQDLARLRLADARVLLNAGRWEAAYYLAGYAIECGLKAAIAKQTRRSDFPPDPGTVNKIYVHDPSKLVRAAGLEQELSNEQGFNRAFATNWALVANRWSEQDRYARRTEKEARELYAAIVDRQDGVMQWVRRHW